MMNKSGFLKLFRLTTAVLALSILGTGTTWGQALPDFSDLVETNAPAIVNVGTVYRAGPGGGNELGRQQQLEELLREFFGEQIPENRGDGGNGGQERFERSSLGSGFIISQDGFIVTNHHVIDGADEINVTLNDRREFPAEVVGSDARSDLALLKIEATGLPTVAMGEIADVEVGEWVLAIGSPFGLSHSVAAGIVSYMGRSLPNRDTDLGNYVSYIQTDVAINPGHSGGPLFNLDGEVIGVNSQIFSSGGGSIGLSFAIPVDVVKNVVNQLMEDGTVSRGWMGVSISSVNQDLAEAFNLDTPRGALVNQVLPGSPAESAGFQSGDVIVAFDGYEITSSGDLPYHVGLTEPGVTVPVEIIRDGERRTVEMTVGNLENSNASTQTGQTMQPAGNPLGVEVADLTEEERAEFGVSGGVRVEAVTGPAAREAGLQPGDVLLRLNNQPIESVEQFRRVVQGMPTDRVLPLLVARNGRQAYFTVEIPGE